MKPAVYVFLLLFPVFASTQKVYVQAEPYPPVEKVAAAFTALLQRPAVDSRPSFETVITDSVVIERGYIYTEATERVPVLVYKPVTPGVTSFPVVICLHGTGGTKDEEGITTLLYQLSKAGMMGVAIDARYHGQRIPGGAHHSQEYVAAITKAWENTDTAHQQHPFLFDTVYDLWRLTDYLVTRPDVQPARIGMMGISMGGIETWMAASVDKRIKVAVPVIAAQSFQWSLAHDKWQGRAGTIRQAHEQAAKDLGDSAVNQHNVKVVWDKLLPGITGRFDCPSMLRLFAPRPLLLLNNEKDLNCPLEGARIAFTAATRAYASKHALHKLQVHVTPNEPHRFLPEHQRMAIAWFKAWL